MVVYQSKPENRLEGLSQYVYKDFCYRARLWIIVHGVRDQLFGINLGINLGRKHVIKS